jgi:hypothetical protein
MLSRGPRRLLAATWLHGAGYLTYAYRKKNHVRVGYMWPTQGLLCMCVYRKLLIPF